MTRVEILLIVCASIMPIVALIFVLPKKLVKKKKEKPEIITLEEYEKKVNPTPVVEEEPKPSHPFEDVVYSPDEFKGYLRKKHSKISKPMQKIPDPDLSFSYSDFMEKKLKQETQKPSNVHKELENLSPELKAMLVAGVLDKKKFD